MKKMINVVSGLPKPKIVKVVGTDGVGIIYLEAKGYSTANLSGSPNASKVSAEVAVYINAAIMTLAKAQNITEDEARVKIFGVSDDSGTVTVMPSEKFDNWLSDEQKTRMIELQLVGNEVTPLEIATNQLKYCFVHHVIADQDMKASPDPSKVSVMRINNAISIGEKILFGRDRVEVVEFAEQGAESISVRNIPKDIESGDPGFIIDFETGQPRIGVPSWEIEDTKRIIPKELIEAIVLHHNNQISKKSFAGRKDNLDDSDLGKAVQSELKSSGNSLMQSQLTGQTSTSESNVQESETPSLNSQILETALTI